MTPDQRHRIILQPLATWAGLMALLGATWTYAYLPHAVLKPEVSLSIGIAKGLLIVLFFMQLPKSAGLVRLASMAGLVWASFLFILTFSDLLTR